MELSRAAVKILILPHNFFYPAGIPDNSPALKRRAILTKALRDKFSARFVARLLRRGQFQNQFGLAVFDLGMDENYSRWKLPDILAGIAITFVLLLVLLFVAIPNFVGDHHYSPMNACINNLRQIDAAKQQWALENNAGFTNRIRWSDVMPLLGRGRGNTLTNIFCPLDSTKNYLNSYKLGDLQTKPKCKKDPATHLIN